MNFNICTFEIGIFFSRYVGILKSFLTHLNKDHFVKNSQIHNLFPPKDEKLKVTNLTSGEILCCSVYCSTAVFSSRIDSHRARV